MIVPDGPAVIVVSGAVVSTLKLRLAGVASVLPAAIRGARLEGMCAVGQRAVGRGLEQAAHEPLSRLHSKLEPASEELKGSFRWGC